MQKTVAIVHSRVWVKKKHCMYLGTSRHDRQAEVKSKSTWKPLLRHNGDSRNEPLGGAEKTKPPPYRIPKEAMSERSLCHDDRVSQKMKTPRQLIRHEQKAMTHFRSGWEITCLFWTLGGVVVYGSWFLEESPSSAQGLVHLFWKGSASSACVRTSRRVDEERCTPCG